MEHSTTLPHIRNDYLYLLGAIVLGPRIDRFRDKKSQYIAGHSIPLVALGGFILIFGFMAFNAGSQVRYYNIDHSNIIYNRLI